MVGGLKIYKTYFIRFTFKMFGYKSVAEYYGACRLHSKVEAIKVPTLAINAEDDPFQPGDSIPTEGANRSSHLAILATKYGGHVGFMEGWMPNGLLGISTQTGSSPSTYRRWSATRTC